MALKKETRPKIQRGISLTPELHDRIRKYSVTQDLDWNGAAVALINMGFRALLDLSESGEDSSKSERPANPIQWGK